MKLLVDAGAEIDVPMNLADVLAGRGKLTRLELEHVVAQMELLGSPPDPDDVARARLETPWGAP